MLDSEEAVRAVDELLEPMRCTRPGNPAPGIEHCAACCYRTGWETTCWEDEGYIDGLLSARRFYARLSQTQNPRETH